MNDQLKAELALLAEQKKMLDAERKGRVVPEVKVTHAPQLEPVASVSLWQRLKGKLGR